MGVYIKGMEMPKKYPVTVTIFPDGISVVKTISGRRFTTTTVSIPPHGQLIDADVLWVEINKICDRRDAGIISDLTCLQQLLSAVRHAPTIIPADQSNAETGIQQEYLQNWHEEGET